MARFSLLSLTVLLGCHGSADDGLTTWTDQFSSDSNGMLEVDIDVERGTESFLVTSESGALLAVEYIYDQSGDIVLDWEEEYSSANSLTGAIWAEAADNVVNWPAHPDDALSPGTWTVVLSTLTDDGAYYAGNQDVDVTVQTKGDRDLTSGTIRATVAYAEGVNNNAEVVSAVEQAVARWDEIWASYGLQLEVSYTNTGVSADLAFPDGSDDALLSISNNGSDDDVLVLIGESIDGDSYSYYGVSGGIPGTLVATRRAGVIASWLANAGTDGSFSDGDIRLFGETLAHEVGHYIGLFHPVESEYNAWDALSDTSDCSSANACENELGNNLMFPYPICYANGGCDPQDQLSDQQVGITQLYTGTL